MAKLETSVTLLILSLLASISNGNFIRLKICANLVPEGKDDAVERKTCGGKKKLRLPTPWTACNVCIKDLNTGRAIYWNACSKRILYEVWSATCHSSLIQLLRHRSFVKLQATADETVYLGNGNRESMRVRMVEDEANKISIKMQIGSGVFHLVHQCPYQLKKTRYVRLFWCTNENLMMVTHMRVIWPAAVSYLTRSFTPKVLTFLLKNREDSWGNCSRKRLIR